MRLGIPIKNRAIFLFAPSAVCALIGLVILFGPAFSPVEGSEEHSLTSMAGCPGTVIEERRGP